MKNTSGGGAGVLHAVYPDRRIPINRAHMAIYGAAIAAAAFHRLSYPLRLPFLAADLVLAFMWAVVQASRWRPIRRRQFPNLLLSSAAGTLAGTLPGLDVFVCTADPRKEPPARVASSVLSAMAFDCPAPERIAVYVSDDACSEITLLAFVMAARFAAHWIPFCREEGVEARSPEIYFDSGDGAGGGGGGGSRIEMMYREMKEKIQVALDRDTVTEDQLSPEEYELFKKWKGFTRRDHASVIEVLLDSSKDKDITGAPLPSLIYVSREKRPDSHHHFKAGALNALLRISGVMTNAPVILTLDCDMYSNDPGAPRRALCYFLDPEVEPDLAYVQFPQRYPGLNENDTYGGEIKRLYLLNPYGMDGLRGPNYVGTGCFHNRRSFFGTPTSSPPQPERPLDGGEPMSSDTVMKKAREVSGCGYEKGTQWGSSIGMRYGSLSEDYHTGYRQHCEGWRSVFCDPERAVFYCDVPITLNDVLSQNKRWCLGLLPVTLSRCSPMTYGVRKASLLMALCYSYDGCWTFWFIPITIYGLLPQLALTHGISLFPKVSDPWFYLYAYLFLAAYGQDLLDFLAARGTVRTWWSDQRMWLIRGVTSYPFATAQYLMQSVGIPAAGFNVTSKVVDGHIGERYSRGMFEFGVASPFFVSLGTFALVNLGAFAAGAARAAWTGRRGIDEMFAQLFVAGFAVANCWPIYEAMFLRRDAGRMPNRVTLLSVLLAGLLHVAGWWFFFSP